MKQTLTCLIVVLLFGSLTTHAQTDCPDIEWMRFFNNPKYYSCYISRVDSNKEELLIGNYEGSPTFGTYNLPAAPNFIRYLFIAKTDSTGNPLWLKVGEMFTYNDLLLYFSTPVTDTNKNIYTVLNFTWKTVFDGITYTSNTLQNNALLIKMDQQGQILWTHLFTGIHLNLHHVDREMNLYFSSDFEDTVVIDGNTYISNGDYDILVLKLNPNLQLLWAQQIGGNLTEHN